AVAAGDLGERAFGAEEAAPGAPDDHHAEQHERPPHAPEYELGEQGHVVEDARGTLGERQHRRQRDEHDIETDDGPLHDADAPLVARQPVAEQPRPPIDTPDHVARERAPMAALRLRIGVYVHRRHPRCRYLATSTACGASGWKSSKNLYSPGSR